MLARLRPESEELSLCFDPTSRRSARSTTAMRCSTATRPSELTKNILQFNESFEQAGARTQNFMKELGEMGLLMDGESRSSRDGADQPFVYRGFQMINEEKLVDLRGDQLRKMSQSGMLPLLYAHLFSLSLMRDIFARQAQLGKMPQPQLQPVG